MRMRSQKRGIRLNHHLIDRSHRERLPQWMGVLERDSARERQEPSLIGAKLRHLGVSRKTMEHRALRGAILGENFEHLFMGVTIVNLQRKIELFRELNVRSERLALGVHTLGAGAESVHTRLANHPDARNLRELGDLGNREIGRASCRETGAREEVRGSVE